MIALTWNAALSPSHPEVFQLPDTRCVVPLIRPGCLPELQVSLSKRLFFTASLLFFPPLGASEIKP